MFCFIEPLSTQWRLDSSQSKAHNKQFMDESYQCDMKKSPEVFIIIDT